MIQLKLDCVSDLASILHQFDSNKYKLLQPNLRKCKLIKGYYKI